MAEFHFPSVPALPGVHHQLKGLLLFLQSNKVGKVTASWECPQTGAYVHVNVERTEREAGLYYREPYPLFFWISLHNSPSFPIVRVKLTPVENESLQKLLSNIIVK